MADIVNLRRFRKQRSKDEQGQIAQENRAKHGLPAAERRLAEATRRLDERKLEQGRLVILDKTGHS